MAITNKEIEALEQRKRELDTKLRMHEASMGGNVRLPRKTKKESVQTEPWQPKSPLKTIDQSTVNKEPTETAYELTQKALAMADAATKQKADIVMNTKGMQNMMTNPIMSSVMKTNPARDQEVQQNSGQVSEKTSTTKPKRRLKKNPNFTTVVPGIAKPLKLFDSVADILGKMYNFMVKKYFYDSRQYKKEKKYRSKLVKTKEERIQELIHLFGGKYTKKTFKEKDDSFFSKLLQFALVGGILMLVGGKDALASVNTKIKESLPKIPDFMSFLGKKSGDKTTTEPGIVDAFLQKITFNQLTDQQKIDFIDAQAHSEGSDKPGTIGYRNNNPGNIVTDQKGQVYPAQAKFGGVAGDRSKSSGLEFVKFPTLELGRAAQIDLWERKYGNLPLNEALRKWVAPKGASEEKEFENYKAQQYTAIKKSQPISMAADSTTPPTTPPTNITTQPNTPKPSPVNVSPVSQTIPQPLPKTINSRTQNVSILNNNTNIVNGSTNMAVSNEKINDYPVLIEKQYYSYG